MWRVIRHGERTPIYSGFLSPCCATARDEAELWRSLLPHPDELAELAKKVGVKHDGGLAWRPSESTSGLLTAKGLASARQIRVPACTYRSTNYQRTLFTGRACVPKGSSLVVSENNFDSPAVRAAVARLRREHGEDEELKKALIDAIPGCTIDNFGWLLAVDYADVREAHDIESYSRELRDKARRFLKSRFDFFFTDASVRQSFNFKEDVVHFAHDITIISALHALNIDTPDHIPFTCDLTVSEDKVVMDGRVLWAR